MGDTIATIVKFYARLTISHRLSRSNRTTIFLDGQYRPDEVFAMSMHAPIYWHEGMFLRPQHFQIAEQNFQSELRQNVHWDRHYSWGLRKFRLDRDALANNRVVITELAARMRDGTLISSPEGGTLPELDLRQVMQHAIGATHLSILRRRFLQRSRCFNDSADASTSKRRHVIPTRLVSEGPSQPDA